MHGIVLGILLHAFTCLVIPFTANIHNLDIFKFLVLVFLSFFSFVSVGKYDFKVKVKVHT